MHIKFFEKFQKEPPEEFLKKTLENIFKRIPESFLKIFRGFFKRISKKSLENYGKFSNRILGGIPGGICRLLSEEIPGTLAYSLEDYFYIICKGIPWKISGKIIRM